GVNLGIFAEGGGRPGEVLGQATAYGEPPTNSWIRATGLAIPVVRGAPYWLALLPLGSGKLHYNVAVAKGGSGDLESKTAELTALAPVPEYWVFNQGPLGLQALGAPASVAIEGAPA